MMKGSIVCSQQSLFQGCLLQSELAEAVGPCCRVQVVTNLLHRSLQCNCARSGTLLQRPHQLLDGCISRPYQPIPVCKPGPSGKSVGQGQYAKHCRRTLRSRARLRFMPLMQSLDSVVPLSRLDHPASSSGLTPSCSCLTPPPACLLLQACETLLGAQLL